MARRITASSLTGHPPLGLERPFLDRPFHLRPVYRAGCAEVTVVCVTLVSDEVSPGGRRRRRRGFGRAAGGAALVVGVPEVGYAVLVAVARPLDRVAVRRAVVVGVGVE